MHHHNLMMEIFCRPLILLSFLTLNLRRDHIMHLVGYAAWREASTSMFLLTKVGMSSDSIVFVL